MYIKCKKRGWEFEVTSAYLNSVRAIFDIVSKKKQILKCEYCGEKALLITPNEIKVIGDHEITPE